MGTTYTQNWSYIENRERKVSFYANLSDTFDGLFVNGTAVDIFQIEQFEKSLNREGGAIESELKMSIDSHNCRSAITAAALNFALASSTITNKRFFAVFVDSISASNILYYGIIQNKYDITDYDWDSALWSETTTPWRRYGFVISPFQKSAFQSVDLETLFAYETGLTSWATWEGANVADRNGYYQSPIGARQTKVKNLVNLNVFLRRLADVFVKWLADNGYGTITITFNDCKLPMQFAPARYNIISQGTKYTRYIKSPIQAKAKKSAVLTDYPFATYANDYRSIYIAPDGTHTDDECLWFDYSMVKLGNDEPRPEQAEELQFKRFDNFTDFLVAIANTFNLQLEMEWTSSSNLEIRFIDFVNVEKSKIYIEDVTESKLQVTATDLEEDYIPDVDGTCFSGDGTDYYIKSPTIENNKYKWSEPQYINPNNKKNKQENGDAVFSISPIVVGIPEATDNDVYLPNGAFLPHNVQFYIGSAETKEYQRTDGIHTAIYLYVDTYNLSIYEAANYWTPAAACANKIYDMADDQIYESLKTWKKDILGTGIDYYDYEKSITVPMFHKFATLANGSDANWNNLALGSQVTYDTIDYLVSKMTYDFENYDIVLDLVATAAFNVTDPDNLTDRIHNFNEGNEGNTVTIQTTKTAIAAETISEGSYLAVKSDGTLEIYRSNTAYYGRGVGFALNDALTGELVQYQFCDVYTIPDGYSDLTADVPVWIVLDLLAPSVINITQTPIESATGTLNLFKLAGIANSTRTINMDHQFEAILA